MRSLHTIAMLLATVPLVLGQELQCKMEKLDFGEHCVFRGVTLRTRMTAVRFAYPANVKKPTQVAFIDSYMKQLPSQFLTMAGPELKVLRVESCGLESVTITSGLEELYGKDNKIEHVIVHQNNSGGSLRTLDLSGNHLSDVSDVIKCQALETLNLNGNKFEGVFDFGKFRGLNKLRKLILSHNDINYLDNTGNVNLESLEDLDLSHNNIITSDLDITIFYPYIRLHTLRLNDNYLSQLDYNYLLNIKSLKTIFLNGNNFKCGYIEVMLKHLHKHDLQTPSGDSNCPDNTRNEFCCTGSLLTTMELPMIRIPSAALFDGRTKLQTSTTTEQPNSTSEEEVSEEEVQEVTKDYFDSSWWYVIPGVVIVGVVFFIIIYSVFNKQQKKDANNPVNGNLISAEMKSMYFAHDSGSVPCGIVKFT